MIRRFRLWLSNAILPRDIAKTVDCAIALGYMLEKEKGWAQAGDPNRQAIALYIPANMLPMYDLFMDCTCLVPNESVYRAAGIWE